MVISCSEFSSELIFENLHVSWNELAQAKFLKTAMWWFDLVNLAASWLLRIFTSTFLGRRQCRRISQKSARYSIYHVESPWSWLLRISTRCNCRKGTKRARIEEWCRTYAWVMSHTWMSQVSRVNESCRTHGWVISHMWMSHVAHLSESCRTCE